jgi:hypothetical protein
MRRTLWIALLGATLALGCGEGIGSTGGSGDGGGGGGGGGGDGGWMPIIPPGSACATNTSDGERLPVNLLLLLDRSGSMNDPVTGAQPGDTRWTVAVRGITSFVTALPNETRVGLTVFPAQRNDSAEGGYTTPVVPVAPLSMTRAQILSALRTLGPSGSTPMLCAMRGSQTYYQNTFRMEGSRSVVLITDGEPKPQCSGMSCMSGESALACDARLAPVTQGLLLTSVQMAAGLSPPTRTFVLGTPEANDMFLSSMASRGLTPRAAGCEATNTCHYSLGNASFEADLNRALDDIRGRSAGCEFRISVDPTMVDLNLVNVNYYPQNGGQPRLIPRDRTHMNGWDYTPDMRTIILYGSTCDEVRMNQMGRIQILFGCPPQAPGK